MEIEQWPQHNDNVSVMQFTFILTDLGLHVLQFKEQIVLSCFFFFEELKVFIKPASFVTAGLEKGQSLFKSCFEFL